MPAYDPPVDRLFTLDPPPGPAAAWPDYLALGLGREHVPALVRMATDPALSRSTDERELWAPLHAWRALGQLGDPAAAAPLLDFLAALDEDEDYAREELPTVLGLLGPTVLPSLAAFLGRRDCAACFRFAFADLRRSASRVGPRSA